MFKQLSAATVLALGLTAYTAAGQEGVTARALPKRDADGFITLFNGHDLTGSTGLPGFWSEFAQQLAALIPDPAVASVSSYERRDDVTASNRIHAADTVAHQPTHGARRG